MKILENPIQKFELKNAEVLFDGPMVKGVVDIEKGIIAIDANMHADLEQLLLASNSKQEDLWGINLWPDEPDEDFVEFDSMINIRPRQNNRSRDVEDPETRQKIIKVVSQWLQ